MPPLPDFISWRKIQLDSRIQGAPSCAVAPLFGSLRKMTPFSRVAGQLGEALVDLDHRILFGGDRPPEFRIGACGLSGLSFDIIIHFTVP